MSKILNIYENKVDKSWYDSSNILYSECDDNTNELKTLRITFKGGRTYEYKGVNVNDYLMFRDNASQGQCFNTLIKKYECEKIENRDVDALMEELELLRTPQFVEITENTPRVGSAVYTLKVYNEGKVKYENKEVSTNTKEVLEEVLSNLNIKVKINNNNEDN